MHTSILEILRTCHFWNSEQNVVYKICMEVACHLFCILNLFSFKFQNSGEMRGSVAQTICLDTRKSASSGFSCGKNTSVPVY
jgi:hypothetical protein